ncbi:hypothetical protein E2626_11515 [Jeotgalibacillus salarius]|uniref:Uncharacterized protein n=1 Tax=Jeotgalibacillus salarius TaxID=546023 RepID=A0A4Y8LG88_9BACL|nr:hypothetical protein E2626_11515 [Jeotgalibacillus salarius]
MNCVKFFIYQFSLFIALLLLNIYFDPYISKPFSFVDLIAICISVPIYILLVSLIIKLYRRFNTRLRNKVLISITAFIIATIFLAIIENIWFGIKGEMLFN